jgi:hypothetical protein
MKWALCLLSCICLLLQTVIAQPCNDTLKATALETSPCTKTNLQLYANGINGATYEWTGPDNFYSTAQNPQRQYLTILQSGNYIVTATTANCIYVDTVHIQLRNEPIHATIYTEDEVCDGDSVSISAYTTGATGAMYIIDAFDNVYYPSLTVRVKMINGGIYKAFEVSTDGCVGDTGYYVANVPIRPAMPTISLKKPACEGDSLILNIKSSDTGVTYRIYAPSGKEISWLMPYVKTIHSGLYKAVALNNIGCVSDTAMMGVAVGKPQIPGIAIYGNADTGPFGTVSFTSYVTKAGNNPTYTWMKNGTPIPGATGYTYTALNGIDILPGDEISLQVLADMMPCPSTGISNALTVSENLLVSNTNATGGISIYPNPNNGIFTIVNNDYTQPNTVTLSNNIGQQVYISTITSRYVNMNVTSLVAGIYILKLQTANGISYQKIVIKH